MSERSGIVCLAGLGNPGPEYSHTRHNAGRLLIEFLVQTWGAAGSGNKSDCDLWRHDRHSQSLFLAVPRTYMNVSGPPLAALTRFYKISLNDLLVCHDDIDLPLGRLQLKRGGSAAGHRGVESLYQSICSTEFYRLRIGVGRGRRPVRDHVLSDFDAAEHQILSRTFAGALDGLDRWIQGDPAQASQLLNTGNPSSDQSE